MIHGLTFGLFQSIGPMEYLIIGVVLLLLFGRRLPEVGRSLGKGLVEFKKGLKDVDDEVRKDDPASARNQYSSARPPLGPSGEERRVSQAEEMRSSTEPAP
ncbi:MAG: twin-arginine translocase TatA/TatE family subunit [Phycisphaeraceae bacterium]|nr:twin-arginine translocase TatA/TatE family subunit [Phycisphaeraceae bacterium]MCW5762486.1 twin-arginine translocase TatA/TatE family subunit [Phycisphaeraceae bacterium]